MPRSDNKFKDIAKTPEMVIDGVKGIVEDSAEWHFFSWKRRYFDFLNGLIETRTVRDYINPLDTWDWDYLPEPSDGYDQNDCAEYYLKQKKCQAMLKNAGYMGLHKEVYKLQAEDYERTLMHPESKGIYRSRLAGSVGWMDPETGLFPDEKNNK